MWYTRLSAANLDRSGVVFRKQRTHDASIELFLSSTFWYDTPLRLIHSSEPFDQFREATYEST